MEKLFFKGALLAVLHNKMRRSGSYWGKKGALRWKFINWHQLMCALFISGKHEKLFKEV